MKDAILRTLEAADLTGIGEIFVHGKDEKVLRFYECFDFEASTIDPMKIMLLIKGAQKNVARL